MENKCVHHILHLYRFLAVIGALRVHDNNRDGLKAVLSTQRQRSRQRRGKAVMSLTEARQGRGRGRGRELEAEARQTKFEARTRRGDP